MKQSLENLRKYVEKIAVEALDSHVVDTIEENRALIKKAISRIENMTEGRNFSLEVRQELQLFDKTCKDALERIEKHSEMVKESIQSEQVDEDRKKSIELENIKKMYEEANSSNSLQEKETTANYFQSTYEELMEKIHTVSSFESLSAKEIEELNEKIDALYTYRKMLASQIEEIKAQPDEVLDEEQSYVEIPLPSDEEYFALVEEANTTNDPTRMIEIANYFKEVANANADNEEVAHTVSTLLYGSETIMNRAKEIEREKEILIQANMYEAQQEAIDSFDIDRIVEVTNGLERFRKELIQELRNGGIPVDEVAEVQDKIDTITRIIQDNDRIVEEKRYNEASIVGMEDLPSVDEVENWYLEAMETTDRNRLVEILNYFDVLWDETTLNSIDEENSFVETTELIYKISTLSDRLSNMHNEIEILTDEEMESLYQEALNTEEITRKEEIQQQLEKERQLIEFGLENNEFPNAIISGVQQKIEKLKNMNESIKRNIAVSLSLHPQDSHKKGIKNLFVNMSWFKKNAKEEKKGKKKKLTLKKATACIIGASVIIAALWAAISSKEKNKQTGVSFKQLQSEGFNEENSKTRIRMNSKQLEGVVTNTVSRLSELNYSSNDGMEVGILTQETKEEKIMDLVKELRDRFNMHDGLNVTIEQALSLYIHLNATNSYENPNDALALDKLTRDNLIKKYYVGLTKDMKEFETYQLDDSDLSRLSTDVQGLCNATLNRVAVLNNQGKYEESREIIAILKDFVTEEALQDEANVLTESIQIMQTSDKQKKKEEIYRYYNYIFAGPKNNVRNFSQYGCYVDGDGKEMTYENQVATMRFYTWFMDGFVGLNITNNLIPQDIINSKEAKLRDQSNLLRILGFKNCNMNTYYSHDFDTPIDNKGRKSSNTTKSSSKSTTKKIAEVLETPQLDKEMDAGLKEHSNVGDSFKLSDQSTVTVVESGPRDTTVIVQPDPGSTKVEDTTPEGKREKETVEGGGNETTEPIKFDPEPTDEVIDEGGDVIFDGSDDEYTEPISFEEDSTDEYYEEPISFEEDSTDEYYEEPISFEEDSTGEYYEEPISFEEDSTDGYYEENSQVEYFEESVIEQSSIQLEIQELYSLRETLLNTVVYTQEYAEFDEGYAKTYHI